MKPCRIIVVMIYTAEQSVLQRSSVSLLLRRHTLLKNHLLAAVRLSDADGSYRHRSVNFFCILYQSHWLHGFCYCFSHFYAQRRLF